MKIHQIRTREERG